MAGQSRAVAASVAGSGGLMVGLGDVKGLFQAE